MPTPEIDLQRVREILSMEELCRRERVVLRKGSGASWVGCCPFHEESSGSFHVGGRGPDRAHCFGCGWDGSIFDFWAARHGLTFREAAEQLAHMAGIAPLPPGAVLPARKAAKVPEVTAADKAREKPPLPRMRPLKDGEIEALAALRGLSVAGVRAAARVFRRVGWGMWPQWLGRDGRWRPREDAAPSWVVTDDERWVAQFRALDGAGYATKMPGNTIKAWTVTGSRPAWPLGAAEMGARDNVILVEGGADMLAGYHFLQGFARMNAVAVVGMLGASNRIAEDALPFFRGKRVRIMMDADEEKEVKSRRKNGEVKVKLMRPGMEAARRWQGQLTAAGAAVESYSLYGLTMVDGRPVKDLNDLARCSAEVVGSDEVMEAFFDFDF